MTIQVTPCDVKQFCKSSLSDAAITQLICVVQAKMGECVESSYDECVAKQILIYATGHLMQSQAGGTTTQKRAANGASITTEVYGGGEGVKSTPCGRMLIMLDSNGCYNSLFASPLLFGVVGSPNSPAGC